MFVCIEISPSIWTKRYNIYLTIAVFSAYTVSYGTSAHNLPCRPWTQFEEVLQHAFNFELFHCSN